jgi:GC-rich sequence DNA-binding factor
MRGKFSEFFEVIQKSRVTFSESMTSTPSVIFKRTKAKTAQRTRQSSPDNATETAGTETGDDSPSTLATKLKNRIKKKPKSRLSFGGDEEVGVRIAHKDIVLILWFSVKESGGEVFQVKKSHLCQKLALGKHPSSVRF